MDSATEYEKNAHNFLRGRDESLVGYKIVRQWANKLPAESEVIEIACGGGYPVTRELAESGLNLWAIDSSKTLLIEFQKRFPNVKAKCERVQDSNFFDRKFDAAIAIGLQIYSAFLWASRQDNKQAPSIVAFPSALLLLECHDP